MDCACCILVKNTLDLIENDWWNQTINQDTPADFTDQPKVNRDPNGMLLGIWS